jgi:hypothetical protein
MITCVELVEGCPQCELEQQYKDKIGHTCGPSSEKYSTLCEVFGAARRNDEEYHRLSHEPESCDECGQPVWDKLGLNMLGTRLCPSGLCSQWFCRFCDQVDSSHGPIDCPTCGSIGRRPAVVRMRSLYRVKRKHW